MCGVLPCTHPLGLPPQLHLPQLGIKVAPTFLLYKKGEQVGTAAACLAVWQQTRLCACWRLASPAGASR